MILKCATVDLYEGTASLAFVLQLRDCRSGGLTTEDHHQAPPGACCGCLSNLLQAADHWI